MVVSLSQLGPFVEGVQVMHFEACIREALGEALGKPRHYRGLVKVVSSTTSQLSEAGNVMINITILHLEFAEFFIVALVFGIVNK